MHGFLNRFLKIFVYLAVSKLSRVIWDLLLQPMNSLVVADRLKSVQVQ